MSYPDDRQCFEDHEWIPVGSPARVGVAEFAARALDEAVYVDLPEARSEVTVGQVCGEIESAKSVSDLVAPASRKVVVINQGIVDDPELATDDPHGIWLYEIETVELSKLMDNVAYEAFAKKA